MLHFYQNVNIVTAHTTEMRERHCSMIYKRYYLASIFCLSLCFTDLNKLHIINQLFLFRIRSTLQGPHLFSPEMIKHVGQAEERHRNSPSFTTDSGFRETWSQMHKQWTHIFPTYKLVTEWAHLILHLILSTRCFQVSPEGLRVSREALF